MSRSRSAALLLLPALAVLLRVAGSARGGRERRRGERVSIRFRPRAVLRLEP